MAAPAASKVTISFDTKNLYDNVYIYIKSACIHNIPRSCTLLDANDEQRIKDPDNDVWFAGDTIEYGQGTDFNQWPRLTKGSNPWEGPPNPRSSCTPTTPVALLLRKHAGKRQAQMAGRVGDNQHISFPDGNDPDDPGYRDGKPCGTYIEVEGFYISNTAENPEKVRSSTGSCSARMPTTTTMRNAISTTSHVRFQGSANDVDWHNDYQEDPGIYVPNPYTSPICIDHSMMLPVKIKGKPVGNLKAEIGRTTGGLTKPGTSSNITATSVLHP